LLTKGRRVAICFALLSLTLSSAVFGQSGNVEVERLLAAGRAEAERRDFTKALAYFNQAMGYLRQASPSHPLNEVVRREIRVTKGRSLVERFRNRSGLKVIEKSELLPLSDEPEEILVRQTYGTVLVRETWVPKEIKENGDFIGFGRRVTVLPEGGVDLFLGKEKGFGVRSVDAASLALPQDGVFDLHSGSFAISSESKDNRCTIKRPLSSLVLTCPDPFAVMIGVTTNGGIKIIGLVGKCKLEQEGLDASVLNPGELIFALPEGYSRKMSVELSTLMVTSKLMTGFDSPPIYLKKVRQQAMIQALRTRKRYKAIVGDAKNSKDFEIRVLEKGQP